MNEIITTVIQAVVQGLTEFLPVSSSGHLSLVQHFMHTDPESNLFMTVILHMGTLLAVFIAFRKDIAELIRELFSSVGDIAKGRFSWRGMNGARRMLFMAIISTAMLVPILPFKHFFEAPGSDGDIIFEGVAFIVTATLLFLSDVAVSGAKQKEDMTVKDSLTIGLFQIFALFPGVSRSGSTISSGIFCGLARKTAVTYSFILGIPAILGGGVLEIKDAVAEGIHINFAACVIGFAVSAVVGIAAIKLVLWLTKKEKFKVFGVYTLLLGLTCIILGAFEHAGVRLEFSPLF